MKEIDKFIRITCIKTTPGNEPCDIYVRASTILDFSVANPEYAKIGGATQISGSSGFLIVKESIDEIVELLSHISVLD